MKNSIKFEGQVIQNKENIKRISAYVGLDGANRYLVGFMWISVALLLFNLVSLRASEGATLAYYIGYCIYYLLDRMIFGLIFSIFSYFAIKSRFKRSYSEKYHDEDVEEKIEFYDDKVVVNNLYTGGKNSYYYNQIFKIKTYKEFVIIKMLTGYICMTKESIGDVKELIKFVKSKKKEGIKTLKGAFVEGFKEGYNGKEKETKEKDDK